MITTYTDYPIFKDEAGNWQRSTTPVVYTVERDSSGPEYLLFSVNGRTVLNHSQYSRQEKEKISS